MSRVPFVWVDNLARQLACKSTCLIHHHQPVRIWPHQSASFKEKEAVAMGGAWLWQTWEAVGTIKLLPTGSTGNLASLENGRHKVGPIIFKSKVPQLLIIIQRSFSWHSRWVFFSRHTKKTCRFLDAPLYICTGFSNSVADRPLI